jgi:hypothetical protein
MVIAPPGDVPRCGRTAPDRPLWIARVFVTVQRWKASRESTREAFIKRRRKQLEEAIMGRGILLWLLGVPIPIIILLALIWH